MRTSLISLRGTLLLLCVLVGSVLLLLHLLMLFFGFFLFILAGRLLELLDTPSKRATNLRELTCAEDNDDDHKDDGQLPWADWHIPDPLIHYPASLSGSEL